MARISDIVGLRPEVTTGDLHGIISLHDILSSDPSAFEKDAARVLAATYPSQAIQQLLTQLGTALSAKMADRKGLFLIHGGYGSGKSHILCVLHHLLSSPEVAEKWLRSHDINFEAPDDVTVILMPMTNLQDPDTGRTVEYIWKPIFHALGYTGFAHTGNNWPTAEDLKAAIAGRRAVVIIDEIERWFLPMRDRHMREANITFLQILSEYASNPDNGYIAIITLLGIDAGVTDILQRPDRFQDDLTGAPDRKQVALHRLVDSVDVPRATEAVDTYLESYRPITEQIRIGDMNRLRDEMIHCYPFHPDTLDLVFQRYSSVARQDDRSYQNSRGALMLLAHVLRQTLDTVDGETGQLRNLDLVLPGDISLSIGTVGDDLAMLNADLVQRARENLTESEQVELATPILSTILLHSMGDPKEERSLGARLEDILTACVRPASEQSGAVTIGAVDAALARLEDTALNVHQEQNPTRWLFRPEVNIATQVNRRAAGLKDQVAREIIVEQLKELLDSQDVVVYPADQLPNDRNVYIVLLAERMAENKDILDKIYHGKAFANGFILIEPRDFGSIFEDSTLLWMGKRIKAAQLLRSNVTGDALARRELQRIEDTTLTGLHERLRDRYGAWRQPIFDESAGSYAFTRVDVPLGKLRIYNTVAGRCSTSAYKEAVLESATRIHKDVPPTVDQVRMDFYQQRSFAKPVSESGPSEDRIDQAITDLIKGGTLEVIDKGDGHYICGTSPGILHKNWQLREAPDEHKPKFVLDDAIKFYLKRMPEGVAVEGIRAYCKREAAGYEGITVKDSDVDLALVQIHAEGHITIGGNGVALKTPLPGRDIVKLREVEGPVPENVLKIDPVSVAKVKTQVVSLINVSDRLKNVRIVVNTTTGGQKALEEAAKYLRLPEAKALSGTKFSAVWTVEDAPIAKRQELIELLNALPMSEDTTVGISLERVVTPSGGCA